MNPATSSARFKPRAFTLLSASNLSRVAMSAQDGKITNKIGIIMDDIPADRFIVATALD